MLARRVAAAPRAEAQAATSSSFSHGRYYTGIGYALMRSRDAQRASSAPATAALMLSSATTTTHMLRRHSSIHKTLAFPSRQTATRPPLAPRATSGNDDIGSSSSDTDSAADGAEGGESESADDSTSPPPSETPTAASQTTTGGKRTLALEARKADRLRSQLLSMMPDPVDDPLFDAGMRGVFLFVFSKFREGGGAGEAKVFFFLFFVLLLLLYFFCVLFFRFFHFPGAVRSARLQIISHARTLPLHPR